jgi:hypothetical protein
MSSFGSSLMISRRAVAAFDVEMSIGSAMHSPS